MPKPSRSCFVSTFNKMLQRCPLGSVVVRNSAIFNPLVMQLADLNVVMKQLDILLQYLVSHPAGIYLLKVNNRNKNKV